MPHPVPVDQAHARVVGDVEHPAVDVGWGTPVIIVFGGVPRRFGHHLPHLVVVAADPAGGEHHRLRAQLELADRSPGSR